MKRILPSPEYALLAVALFVLPMTSTLATETDFAAIDGLSVFSQTFLTELNAAKRAADVVPQLETLYQKFNKPAEQAEIELTLARVLCQRTGLVDPAQSIQWYDKALVRDLPATALAKQFLLRGNMHERLKHSHEALADYVRGLLTCLQFNLPDSWPKHDGTGQLQPAPINSGLDFPDAETPEHRLARRQQTADYRRDDQMIRREQDLLQQRYYYIDAIKRVSKDEQLSEAALRTTAEKLTNRKDRVEELLRRVRAPNPRPWP